MDRVERELLWGVLPRKRVVTEKLMTLDQLDAVLGEDEDIGTPDYADEGMIQFLKTERVIPPYQNKGLQAHRAGFGFTRWECRARQKWITSSCLKTQKFEDKFAS